MESFCIASRHDRNTGNDLLVRSWSIYGDDPPSKIVHFFKKQLEEGYTGENLAIEYMFASESYRNQPLDVEVQILEVDGDDSIAGEIKLVAGLLGAVFPVILPFTGLASGLLKNLQRMQEHDNAFGRSIQFWSRDGYQTDAESPGLDGAKIPFRSGAHIFFEKEVERDKYRLRELKLETKDDSIKRKDYDNYVVIKIIPKVINSLSQEDLLANQRLAINFFRVEDEQSQFLPERIRQFRGANPVDRIKNDLGKAELLEQLTEYIGLQNLIPEIESDSKLSTENVRLRKDKLKEITSKIKQYF
ncbi:MAG: hypothetical protein QNJ46_18495 [Leptolyngbyaceae cyanobacterium MO_188.B28]|nr:hypothetical protein [Leptolyngbyaceae cyanobacterium MO_188.B28]